MYEHKKQKLASTSTYRKRLRNTILFSTAIISASLMLGVVGYKFTIPEFDWYDCLLNASMILSGMGPIIEPNIVLSKSAKLFASFYALFSGITFLSSFGLILAPILHRFFHKLHLETDDQ